MTEREFMKAYQNKCLKELVAELKNVTPEPLVLFDGRKNESPPSCHYNWRYYGGDKKVIVITCPWCATEVLAYVWSLAGSGKRCPNCKAVHRYINTLSFKEKMK